MPGASLTGSIIAKGSQLHWAREATPTVFVRLAGLISISGPKMARDGFVDATELDPAPTSLPVGRTEESYYYKGKVPATKDLQPIAVELNIRKTQHTDFLAAYTNDELLNFKIILRDGSIYTFGAYIDEIGTEIQEGQLVKTPVTLMPTGILTWTPSI